MEDMEVEKQVPSDSRVEKSSKGKGKAPMSEDDCDTVGDRVEVIEADIVEIVAEISTKSGKRKLGDIERSTPKKRASESSQPPQKKVMTRSTKRGEEQSTQRSTHVGNTSKQSSATQVTLINQILMMWPKLLVINFLQKLLKKNLHP